MQSTASNYTQPLASKPKRRLWPYVIIVLWLLLLSAVFVNRNRIYDWWRLLGYKAPSQILALAKDDTMTPYALTLLEINHPQIQTYKAFNQYCPDDGGEKTIVLGCYHSDENGIYLLSVSDPRLNGVMQVTAAHEMLHAAYSRLSAAERNKVDGWLLSYYEHDLKDPRIIATIAAYRKSEPTQVVNEMHSVFGTEVMNLPKPLENYYKRYFTDRQKIAAYANQYQNEFTSRQAEVKADDAKLVAMLSQINSQKATIEAQYNQIVGLQKQLSSLASNNDISQYNALVNPYNQAVDSYNASVNSLQGLINSYNALVNIRNKVSLIENQLFSELSGTPSTIQTKQW